MKKKLLRPCTKRLCTNSYDLSYRLIIETASESKTNNVREKLRLQRLYVPQDIALLVKALAGTSEAVYDFLRHPTDLPAVL